MLTLQATLIAGSASGVGSRHRPASRGTATSPTWDATGVTFDSTTGGAASSCRSSGRPTYSFIPGAATGIVGAAGVTFETRASFMGSPANVLDRARYGPRRAVTAVASLVPGTGQGAGLEQASGGRPAWTNVEKPGDGWTIAFPGRAARGIGQHNVACDLRRP
jgi:hypothetical protein